MPVKEVQLLDEDDIFCLLKDWIEWHISQVLEFSSRKWETWFSFLPSLLKLFWGYNKNGKILCIMATHVILETLQTLKMIKYVTL